MRCSLSDSLQSEQTIHTVRSTVLEISRPQSSVEPTSDHRTPLQHGSASRVEPIGESGTLVKVKRGEASSITVIGSGFGTGGMAWPISAEIGCPAAPSTRRSISAAVPHSMADAAIRCCGAAAAYAKPPSACRQRDAPPVAASGPGSAGAAWGFGDGIAKTGEPLGFV